MQWNELKSHLRHIPAKDLQRIQKAFELGKKVHEGQKRKSGEPYFTHPIAVAHILADMGADADTIIAALLHDTIEDTDLTLEEVDEEFGGDVASLIDGVTKFEPDDLEETPTLDDQIETLRKMFNLMDKDIRVMVIKLVDRLHNMQNIEHLSEKRAKEMAKETLDIYVKIADRFSMQDLRDELEGLCIGILEPEKYIQLQKLQQQNECKGEKAIEDIENDFYSHERTLAETTDILYERKPWKKLKEQLNAGNAAATGVSAITVVFMCEKQNDCYAILGALHSHWQRETLSFQDFINAPMINGYRGLHTTIILENGMRVRCKIRTQDMHIYAREGITTMCFDSEAAGAMEYLLPWTERISSLSSDTKKRSIEFWNNLENDILGESIVVHGPNDEQIVLPKNVTALDAALYLYGKKALKLKEIYADGKKVPLYESIQNASTITATFTNTITAQLEWLDIVNTGIATAHIREELAKTPAKEKQKIGKSLLEKTIKTIAHIGLNELSEEGMQKKIHKSLGINTMQEIYEQIGGGKLSASEVVAVLFPEKLEEQGSEKVSTWILQASFPSEMEEEISSIAQVVEPEKIIIKHKHNTTILKGYYKTTASKMKTLRTQLSPLLKGHSWSLIQERENFLILGAISTLVMLWGLDPVFAKLLLRSEIAPVDLTAVRFVMFFVATSFYYVIFLLVKRTPLRPINPLKPSLVLSGITMFMTAIFTYLTLTMVSATAYIICIVSVLTVSNILSGIRHHKSYVANVLALLLLILAGYIVLRLDHATPLALLFGSISSLGFVAYSFISDRYRQEVEGIHARYPAFLFWLSVIILPLTVALTPLSAMEMLPEYILGAPGLFVLIFSILPYGIYFECMRRVRMTALLKGLPLVCIWTLLGDLLVNKSTSLIPATPFIFLGVSILVFQQFWKRSTDKN